MISEGRQAFQAKPLGSRQNRVQESPRGARIAWGSPDNPAPWALSWSSVLGSVLSRAQERAASSCLQLAIYSCCCPHPPAQSGWHWLCSNERWLPAGLCCCYVNGPTRPFHLGQNEWSPGAGTGLAWEMRKRRPLPSQILPTGLLADPVSALLPGTGVMRLMWLWKRSTLLAWKMGCWKKKELGKIFNVLNTNLIFHLLLND